MGKWTVQWVFLLLTGIRESLSLIILILWRGLMFYLLLSSITLWGLPALYSVIPVHLFVTKNYAKTLIYDNQIISVHRPLNKWRQTVPSRSVCTLQLINKQSYSSEARPHPQSDAFCSEMQIEMERFYSVLSPSLITHLKQFLLQ